MSVKPELLERLLVATNRVTKWRSVFAGWELGTHSKAHGPTLAVRDHRELTILLRVEVNALAGLLIKKGAFTEEEWAEQLIAEADWYNERLAEKFPGMTGIDDGISMKLPEARDTMRRLHFPA